MKENDEAKKQADGNPDSKKDKGKKEKNSKKINVTVAPANWARMKKYLQSYNESENRTGPKLKYTDVINEAISRYITQNIEK